MSTGIRNRSTGAEPERLAPERRWCRAALAPGGLRRRMGNTAALESCVHIDHALFGVNTVQHTDQALENRVRGRFPVEIAPFVDYFSP